jgi:hypothetical protein
MDEGEAMFCIELFELLDPRLEAVVERPGLAGRRKVRGSSPTPRSPISEPPPPPPASE